MSGLRFDIPAYDQAMANLVGAVIDGFIALNPVLKWLGPFQLTRHTGPTRNIAGRNPLDQSMRAIKSTHFIEDLSIIRNTDVDAYADTLREMAQSFVREISSGFFRDLDEMFDHAADAEKTSLEIGETLLDWDSVLDRLENAEVAFDENGQPILPALHSGTPEQKEHLRNTMADEYKRRFREIIEHKRRLHDAEGRAQ